MLAVKVDARCVVVEQAFHLVLGAGEQQQPERQAVTARGAMLPVVVENGPE
jgi:hypothetical protein